MILFIIFIVEVDKGGYVGNAKGEYRGLYLEPNKDRALSIAPINLLLEKGEKNESKWKRKDYDIR